MISSKLKRGVKFCMAFTSNYADGSITKAVACSSSGIDVVGKSTTKGEQGIVILLLCGFKIVFQLAPLVAAKFRVSQVFAFYRKRDTCRLQQGRL